MPEHLPPSRSKARTLGVLACALTIPVVALVWSQLDRDDRRTPPVRPTAEGSTAPTVLAQEVVPPPSSPDSLPDSPPTSPATFLLPDPSVVPEDTSSTTPPPTLIPPVVVTPPAQRTTTTRPATTTTAPLPGDG